MILIIIFWVSVFALIHSYIVYPTLIGLLARTRTGNINIFKPTEELPDVAVLMAVHNEEDVIHEKLNSILANAPPVGKLNILIGSDASTDKTNILLEELSLLYENLTYIKFSSRIGKSAVINELVRLSGSEILIITDANVIFGDNTIYHLIKHFKNPEVGLVDSNMKHKGLKNNGISVQENAYISREVRIKYNEGKLWGTMMGPFGGCYAIRRKLYSNVPDLFLVDDFYINMKVIKANFKAIMEPEALVFEDVSNSLIEEFRRKIRIAAGNFQNLKHFSGCLFSSIPGLSFSYFSHKVLRWMGPFFLSAIFLSTVFLRNEKNIYSYLFVIQLIILILPIIDYLLGKIKIHIIILRFITHFLSMNCALLVGFIKYLKGVKSNVWQPTRRNQ
jgi:cellulose synthase/poly-beta-1,6-N-acetylglucosamine synthase-like glycosyltransferase